MEYHLATPSISLITMAFSIAVIVVSSTQDIRPCRLAHRYLQTGVDPEGLVFAEPWNSRPHR
jgi:hypothetical protein